MAFQLGQQAHKGGSTKTGDYDRGVHGQISYTWYLTNCMTDVQNASIHKHIYRQTYINVVENFYDSLAPYIEKDRLFYEQVKALNTVLMNEYNQLPAVSKEEYRTKIYPIKLASYIYRACLHAARRQNLLPFKREVVRI